MITVTFYYRDACPECDQALADLESLQSTIPHQLVKVNVDQERGAKDRAGQRMPFLEIGPFHLQSPFNRQDLQIMLSAARDRIDQLERVDQSGYQQRLEKGRVITSSDRISAFLSNHYLALLNLLIFIYVGLPFLAPVLMKANVQPVASIIYKIYSPMCHQLAFRSWFLFGEQAYYPRELAGINNVIPYEALQNSKEVDLLAARAFVGNPTVGYKVALCERDVAIYIFMLLFGLVYSITGRRFRTIPWYIWFIVGLGPIGLDGFSQLPSLASGLPSWLPLRESTPLLRTITGGMFGWMTAWYLFPMIEETSRETRQILQRKFAVIRQTSSLDHS